MSEIKNSKNNPKIIWKYIEINYEFIYPCPAAYSSTAGISKGLQEIIDNLLGSVKSKVDHLA